MHRCARVANKLREKLTKWENVKMHKEEREVLLIEERGDEGN